MSTQSAEVSVPAQEPSGVSNSGEQSQKEADVDPKSEVLPAALVVTDAKSAVDEIQPAEAMPVPKVDVNAAAQAPASSSEVPQTPISRKASKKKKKCIHMIYCGVAPIADDSYRGKNNVDDDTPTPAPEPSAVVETEQPAAAQQIEVEKSLHAVSEALATQENVEQSHGSINAADSEAPPAPEAKTVKRAVDAVDELQPAVVDVAAASRELEPTPTPKVETAELAGASLSKKASKKKKKCAFTCIAITRTLTISIDVEGKSLRTSRQRICRAVKRRQLSPSPSLTLKSHSSRRTRPRPPNLHPPSPWTRRYHPSLPL